MLIIGIAGGTGSGKTTIVNELIKKLPSNDFGLISQDSYYKDTSQLSLGERATINFDHPNAIDFDLLFQHIKQLKNGKTIHQPVYSFVEHNRTHEVQKTPPKKVFLIEGILVLTHSALRNLMDIKIYVDTDADERLIRRLKRDTKERGRTTTEVLERYQETLKPMHQQFIAPSRAFADIIVPNNRHNFVAINILKDLIKTYLA